MADLFNVRQVFHHLDQTHHCANDADGRRIPTGTFQHLGFGLRTGFFQADLELQHRADLLQITAIDRQHQRLLQERIADFVHYFFQRNQARLASLGGIAEDFFQLVLQRGRRIADQATQTSQGTC